MASAISSPQELLQTLAAQKQNIEAEAEARRRMALCRQLIGIGRAAVALADDLSDADIQTVQEALRLAHGASKGVHNANTSITKLAQHRMSRLGLETLQTFATTRPKVVGTDTAALALSDGALAEDWPVTPKALAAFNAERFFYFSTGFDGDFSVTLRHVDAPEPFLKPAEYKKVVEVLPPFGLQVTTEQLYFGSAEAVTEGAKIALPNGRYYGQVASLRSGRHTRYVASFVAGGREVPLWSMVPEMREL